ncbi:unnamed protein product [Phytophthora lilii]|uniref:Unnamed protein product n=1 Tax=Phytophthora lilii TaxID=2077276 RepID=A0A9W6YI93_9STRA|nr:unnamed protein product [Phytophthora lilii]
MVLEVAVEKAATERPTFSTWPYPGTSPSLSALEDGYVSEEFGFSDGDGSDESKVVDFRYEPTTATQNPMTGSFVDFIDPSSPKENLSGDYDAREDYDHVPSSDSECEATAMPFAREVEITRLELPSSDATANIENRDVAEDQASLVNQDTAYYPHKMLLENPFSTRLRLELISSPTLRSTKHSIANYFTRFRSRIDKVDEREQLKRIA